MAVNASMPKGTRDFLPSMIRQRERVLAVIRDVYRRHGFEPLETPAIENIETLTGKYGDEGDKLLFRILKRGAKAASGECDLGLRYDLTVPLARVVAMHQNELPRIFKRYQIQPVWRADRPGHGRFREFFQCDIDVVGAPEPLPEIDMLSAVAEVFATLGFPGITLRLNDRRVLRGVIEAAGIAPEAEVQAIMAMDKLDKIGADGVRDELLQRGIGAEAATKLLALLAEIGASPEPLATLERLLADKPTALSGVTTLGTILHGLEAMQLGGVSFAIDATLARGLDYYTGAIFEAQSTDLGTSLAGGGRYDGLVGMFLGRELPACGVSLGLERMLVVMQERGMFGEEAPVCDAMVASFGASSAAASLATAATLRRAGLAVDLYPIGDKLGKQFAFANERKIPWVVVVGPDEAARSVVKLKDMRTGEQSELGLDEAIARMRAPAAGVQP